MTDIVQGSEMASGILHTPLWFSSPTVRRLSSSLVYKGVTVMARWKDSLLCEGPFLKAQLICPSKMSVEKRCSCFLSVHARGKHQGGRKAVILKIISRQEQTGINWPWIIWGRNSKSHLLLEPPNKTVSTGWNGSIYEGDYEKQFTVLEVEEDLLGCAF